MKVPVSWLRELTSLPSSVSTEELAARLTAFDLKLEEIIGGRITGPLVVGRVLTAEPEPQKNGKTINWCRVDVGPEHNEPATEDVPAGRGIVCGAHNFGPGDLVVVSLPGTFLPAMGFEIGSRKTYGHVSDGMICSTAELGLPGDASGILVLEPGSAEPGADAVELLGLNQETLDLEVNPDRGYAWSMRGVARDTALAFGLPFEDPADIAVPEAEAEAYPVVVEDAAACPVFTTLRVSGFDPTRPTPAVIARRLVQAGMRSISLAVDVSNYVMLELGQPNHAYDAAKLKGPIRVRRAAAGERLTTLDDIDRALDPQDLLICDDDGPVGLAGVMGAARVEIDDATTDIVIEAAHFDRATIARASRRHRLSSEAARRFERGVDPTLQVRAARRVAELLVEHGGGQVEPGLTVVGEVDTRREVVLPVDLPRRIAGVESIDTDAAVRALEGNACEVRVDGESLVVVPPPWRFDINDPYDVVEEVLRVVGYDQVPSVLPQASGGRGLTRAQELRRRVGYALAGDGLVEVKTFPFAGPADFDRLGLGSDDERRRQVLLENPLSAEEPGLTTTLLTGLLRSASLNVGRGHDDVAISEVGRVFRPRSGAPAAPIYGVDRRPTPEELAVLDAALPDQPLTASWVLLGDRERGGWDGPGRPVAWADAVAVARRLADVLHVEVSVEAASLAPFHPGRCAALVLDGRVVGHAGELHPKVAEAYGLPPRAVAGEVDLDALLAAAPEIGPRPDFSAFPVAKEDLAFIVESTVPAGALQQALAEASPLIESVRLFDLYTGEPVPQGHVSLAFNVRLRADDHTLTEDEIAGARAAAVQLAADRFGATLR
ncbi:phenylalanine--tRNA ligase subunit beta [Aeromicrobium sp. PE09-221]|uniref:phenylalanine--tRNA ligase subunit beta n=1 Tax=Aeromicrobium sp. PE09-221 TaxID=1898043 RepID=UPI000B3E5DEE|nr:phenylalanine--tRNA ligase subunit beta [Aeromicrobium sp. PE09-221]OUZ09774.1 phenylalanine--tRNA ligase subunit beta [Aeromicrobium sp. PE09-221]